jgi:hypothetical protein
MEELFSLWLRINGRLKEVEMTEADVDSLELQIARTRARKQFHESGPRTEAAALEVR